MNYHVQHDSYVLVCTGLGQVYFGRLLSRVKSTCVLLYCKELWYAPFPISIKKLARFGMTKRRRCLFTPSLGRKVIVGVTHVYKCSSTTSKQITSLTVAEAGMSKAIVREG